MEAGLAMGSMERAAIHAVEVQKQGIGHVTTPRQLMEDPFVQDFSLSQQAATLTLAVI